MRGLFKFQFLPFFSPLGDFSSGGQDSASLSGETDQGDLDILNDDSDAGDDNDGAADDDSEDSDNLSDDDKEDKEDADDKSDDKDDKEKDDKEDKEDDDKDDDDDDEDVEEETETEDDVEASPETRTTLQRINKYDKKLLKKFPEVRRALFVSQEYSKVFGSIDDAKEAAGKGHILDGFTQDIESGDVSAVIQGIAKTMGKDHAINFAKGFLPSVAAIDRELYREVADPAIKMAVRAIFNHGVQNKSKNHVLAAQYISQFLWDNEDVAAATSFKAPEKVDRTRENEFISRQIETSEAYVDRRVTSKLSKRLVAVIDPNGERNSFERDALVSKAIAEVNKIVISDKAFGAQLKSLWRKAQRDGFAADSLTKIVGAYLGRANVSMPAVLAKMKISGKKEKIKGKTTVTPESRGQRNESQKVVKSGDIDYRRTSDADILNDKVTFKGSGRK